MLLHSFFQLVARTFLYASLLLVIPSFIAITTPEQYADILLIATIAALAVQFDGGCANNLLSTYSSFKDPPARSLAKHLSNQAIKDTALWSLGITVVFILGWTSLSPTSMSAMYTLHLFVLSALVAIGCATSNTASKSIYALKGPRYSVLGIPAAACITFGLLLAFRIFRIHDLLALVTAFLSGYLVLLYIAHSHLKALPNEGLADQGNRTPLNKHQKWIFTAQVTALLLAAKNPILLRILVGNEGLPTFSVCSAIYSILLAPAAAVQTPILVKFNAIKSSTNNSAMLSYALKATLQILTVTILVAAVTLFLYHIFHEHFLGKNVLQLTIFQLGLICLSALMSASCVVVACYLMALKEFFLLAKLGLVVLVCDSVSIWVLSTYFQGATPVYTIFLSNVVSMIYLIACKNKRP
jgi:hypothetical protein